MTVLQITTAQAELLRECLGAAQRAQADLNLAFTAIVRGHGLTEATIVDLEGTALTVRLPEMAAHGE